MTAGRVVSIQLCKGHREPMAVVPEAVAISDFGLEGDRHAMKGNARQVLLVDVETLQSYGLAPGIVRENITVEGVQLSSIDAGQVFFIGEEVTLEVTGDCLPCSRMDEIRPGLREEISGRRGVLATVLSGGTLKVGDMVRVEPG